MGAGARGIVPTTLCIGVLVIGFGAPNGTAEAPWLTGFQPNLPGVELDDAVWIRNRGAAFDLEELELSDNQGRVGFPPGAWIASGQEVAVAGNASAFFAAAGVWPDFALSGLPLSRTLRSIRSGFALGQEGDFLELAFRGEAVDAVVYGTGRVPSAGWSGSPVDVRGGDFLRRFPRVGPEDHDRAADWQSPRRFYLGQQDWPPVALPVDGEIIAYLAPDHARSIVELALGLAQRHVRLNVYEFRDLDLADFLAERRAEAPGLAIDVLLDASPVGETRDEHSQRGHAIARLRDAGANVHVMQHGRYGFNHAKYAVIDDRIALIQSENLVPSGIPADHKTGNRGWGVFLANATVAHALARIFDADFQTDVFGSRETDTRDEPEYDAPLLADFDAPMTTRPLVSTAPAAATLVVSPLDPHGADPIVAVLRAAEHSIRVAQLNFPPVWRDATGHEWPHPYLDEIRGAALRGVSVEVLLDGHFLDGGRLDNAATVEAVASLPNSDARLVPPDRRVLHVKGLVVDERWVLVGSMNWNLHSMLQNREVDVLLEHPEAAAFFARAFDGDWAAAAAPPAESGAPSLLAILLILLPLVRAVRGRNAT